MNSYRLKPFLALAVLFLCAPAFAVPQSPWWWLLPGGGQFTLGQNKAGWGYLGSTAGLAAWAGVAESRKETGEINAPFIYAQQVYVLSMTSAYRDLRLRHPLKGAPPVDPTSTGSLALAPFRWEAAKSPWVWGSALAGAGVNLLLLRRTPGYGRMRRMRYLGGSFNRETALPVYTAYWLPISLGAGVSEESLFRGALQHDFETRWGAARGLWAASALFGLGHLSRLNSAESWAQASFATGGGLYFGWRYQKTGYRLSQPVAAHFWFDAAAGLAIFLANPGENPLGARMEFAF